MLGNAADPTGSRYIPLIKEAGYDYAELPLAQVMELDEEKFQELRVLLKRAALPCRCCNNFYPASVRLTGEKVSSEKAEEYTKRAVKRAELLGSRFIVFGSSGAKNVPAGFPEDRAFEQIVSALRMAARYAGPAGIRIAIEPLNRKESNIICSLAEGRRLMDAVGSPQVGLLVDFYHFAVEKDSYALLEENGGEIIHVHFASPEGRSFPAENIPEYERFFKLLKLNGYDGGVSIEAFTERPRQDLIKGGNIVRSYFRQTKKIN